MLLRHKYGDHNRIILPADMTKVVSIEFTPDQILYTSGTYTVCHSYVTVAQEQIPCLILWHQEICNAADFSA